jgi:hypothetical protein
MNSMPLTTNTPRLEKGRGVFQYTLRIPVIQK